MILKMIDIVLFFNNLSIIHNTYKFNKNIDGNILYQFDITNYIYIIPIKFITFSYIDKIYKIIPLYHYTADKIIKKS